MSRSHRKTPIAGITKAASDKWFKQREHRRERRAAKERIGQGDEPANPKKFGNPWASDKDGKAYWRDATPRDMRK